LHHFSGDKNPRPLIRVVYYKLKAQTVWRGVKRRRAYRRLNVLPQLVARRCPNETAPPEPQTATPTEALLIAQLKTPAG